MDEQCACGVTLPLMRQPDGRTTDVLRLPSGRSLNHRLMAMFSKQPDSVKLFQIHQRADYSIVVRVVPGDGPELQPAVAWERRHHARAHYPRGGPIMGDKSPKNTNKAKKQKTDKKAATAAAILLVADG